MLAASWKAAGFSYNKYLSIAARVIRKSLKEEARLKAEKRGPLELKFAKWENGKQGEAQNLYKN
ncbi:mitochondrial ATP synthase epsilon chain-domain-containing protein [Pyronema domesticum]|uniref:Similar to Putative ATP synthase subunit epsilon, mitochondrial acc. no. P87316 n=1 Tax=Pyronema omphalodes (strain CBS 100304) TaxID=1076935 RepID=U4LFF7_PYROM|nr:mitochondrial ATP synthase epsilon chain-domain-containing protein [Pyronema domesticum]KAI5819621.1 mitochondrial ATP synthase epsilon chain-domain-containing protein [Pyronema omphalodes]CCX30814.1 Similar to Putative ATP synthase subunit epsilon, mitochondrial; acc. no. P87316 [Pyronema omphalodes CBS 100304]